MSDHEVEIPAAPLRRLRDRGPVFSWGGESVDRPNVPELRDTLEVKAGTGQPKQRGSALGEARRAVPNFRRPAGRGAGPSG